MQNIKHSLSGNTLTIQIDVTGNLGPSKSGKTQLIATSGGNQTVKTPTGDIVIGLNCYRKA